jgi:hypothetical protein
MNPGIGARRFAPLDEAEIAHGTAQNDVGVDQRTKEQSLDRQNILGELQAMQASPDV